jgi:putative serine protease PepD
MRFKRFLLTVGAGFLGAAMLLVAATALGWTGGNTATGGTAKTAYTSFETSDGLTPQQIYDENVGGVVEIVTTFPGTTDIWGQSSGGGQALGTGFVVSKDGYILTNAHVVSESGQAVSTVVVVFKGSGDQQTKVEGTVVGADESTDVALIKVDPSQTGDLTVVSLGDSSAVRVGEQVVAIGNPEGLDFTLTTGVVSATDREMQSPNGATITGGIQTDAAINPGNSGGPLIDSSGKVIGINEQISTQSGGNEGLGFAVPINTAVKVMEQIKSGQLQQQAQPQTTDPNAGPSYSDPYGQGTDPYSDPYGQGYGDPYGQGYSDPYGEGYGDPYGQGYSDAYGGGLY